MRLPISPQQHKTHYKNYFLLLVICLLAYWPLTFGVFSVKNDAIHYFLPYRFQISETIRNGELPFWNPYIYLGYPVHGDMQSGAWNPIVWFFSLISRYDLTLFHFENLLYIFLGGIGMYKLTNRQVNHTHTALLIAVSYMLSGFMLSGQLINWLAAAAFLPFVIDYYLQTLRSASFSSAAKTGVAFYFLLVSGYPSFFIITGYILLAFFILTIINRLRVKGNLPVSWKNFILQHLLLIVVFIGLALPAIISFIELLPYYQRGGGAGYNDVVQNSFELKHFLSSIFPSTIKANDLVSATDITCRNVYIGLFTLIILACFPPRLSRRHILLFILVLFAILFSLGDTTPVRKICYNLIPFMDTFRHPSQMRLFFLFAILLLAASGLKELMTGNSNATKLKKLKQFIWTIIIILAIITVIALFKSGILKRIPEFRPSEISATLKDISDNANLADTIALNGLMQLVFLGIFIVLLKKPILNKLFFSSLWIANLFVMAQLVLPSTFFGKTSPKEINSLIHSSPRAFPVAGLSKSITENSKDASENFDKIGLSYFYNKKIGISHVTNSPSFLTQQEEFIENDLLYNYVASLPVIYIADSIMQLKDTASIDLKAGYKFAFTEDMGSKKMKTSFRDTAVIKKISANKFEIETKTETESFIVLTQNYHHNWKVWIDDMPEKIYKTNISFMGIPIPAGKHTIIFRYVPYNIIKAVWIMLATAILLLIAGAVSLLRKTRLNHRE